MRSSPLIAEAERQQASREAARGGLFGALRVCFFAWHHDAIEFSFSLCCLCPPTDGMSLSRSQWGLVGAMLGAAGYAFSPVYRGLTTQFKMSDFRFHRGPIFRPLASDIRVSHC